MASHRLMAPRKFVLWEAVLGCGVDQSAAVLSKSLYRLMAPNKPVQIYRYPEVCTDLSLPKAWVLGIALLDLKSKARTGQCSALP